MKKHILTYCLSLLALFMFAQTKQNPWTDVRESSFASANAIRHIVPTKYRTVSLDLDAMKAILAQAPMRFTPAAENWQPTFPIPMPDGTVQEFQMVEAPVMHPDLAVRYPYMRSFAGWSKTDGTAYLRCGFTQKGFHAMILSAQHSTVYIDAYAVGDDLHYISYYKKDYPNPHQFECLVTESEAKVGIETDSPKSLSAGDCQHRNYALALACTGEYATFHGGTKPLVLAEFNVAMTRINGIYEREFAVTMTMVANTDLLIYLNAGSDPYTNNDGGTMLNQNQTTCNSVIGNANYDIGHVFSTGGGGIAQLNAVCNNSGKARGVTGLGSPVGDPFYVDYVAHEMGHQFGGNHTQNNDCNRNGSTAMEPGSASTIMGYAGICAPDVQNNSDDYFHAINHDEIHSHITGGGNTCATTTPSGNNAPVASLAVSAYNVPISTPFVLTAQAVDGNSSDMLTYCWEQMNNQVATMPPLATNTVGPAFRSLDPSTSPSRYFPNLAAILAGTTPTWEVLPSVGRSMAFRCTVRDNHPGAGCTDEVDLTLTFSASAGPFIVTNPNTSAITWTGGSTATVTWNVANTNTAPVSVSQVEIFLSADGGLTYPYTLSTGTNNDGTEVVNVPNIATTQARVMVKAKGNVFFDISNQNFKINLAVVPDFVLTSVPDTAVACQNGQSTYTYDIQQLASFNLPINFTASGLPTGAIATFTPNNVPPPTNVSLTVGNLMGAAPGIYNIVVTAVGGSVTHTDNLVLQVLDQVNGAANLSSPNNGAEVATSQPSLTWAAVANASEYLVEIAESPTFSPVLFTGSPISNSYQVPSSLDPLGVYYWRVKALNPCSESAYSETFAFHVGGIGCQTFNATGLPLAIPNFATTVSKTLNVPASLSIVSVQTSMNIDHSYVGDLSVELVSPQNTAVQVFDQPGVPASDFGCENDDINASFADSYTNTATAFENMCMGSVPTISGNFQPMEAFAGFVGQNAQGNWTLNITDSYDADGGALLSWSLQVCGIVPSSSAVLLQNNVLNVPQGQSGTISQAYLQAQGSPTSGIVFTLLGLPTTGSLELNGSVLIEGSTFTQADIDAGNLVYLHDGSMASSDQFEFNLLDADGRWLPTQVFHINIIQNTLAVTAAITQAITCFGANDGVITVSANGGTAPLEYSLNGGAFQSSNVFSGLAPGSYTIEVKDAIGFVVSTGSLSLDNALPIAITASVNVDVITATGNGGTGALQFSIGGAFQGSNVFSGLANGVYTVTVQDANGCTATTTAIVAVNTLIVTATVSAPISCFGANDGQITVNANGGTAPLEYSLNGGPYQGSNVFAGLGAGTYTITTIDSDGLTQNSPPVVLSAPSQIAGSAVATGYTVTVTANGGTGILQYSLDGGAFQSNNSFAPVASGSHSITIKDANGCEATVNVTVSVQVLAVSGQVTQAISCNGGSNGQITVSGTGGVPTYQYSLNGGAFQSSNTFNNLPAGSYTISIMDSGGFTDTAAVLVSEPSALVANANAVGSNITVFASGGTAPYLYQLDNGALQNSNTFNGVAVGTHTITVVDENGCEKTVSVFVGGTPPNIFVSISNQVSCHNGADGVITVSASGGTAPYTYSLNGGTFQSSNMFSGLPAGTYTVTVKGADGAVTDAPNVVIINPPALSVTATVAGLTVTANAIGGTGAYEYSLDGVNFDDSNELEANGNGTYTVTVKDENGCTATTSATINVVVGVNWQATDVSCYGKSDGKVQIQEVVGGTPPYLYSFNGSPFATLTLYSNLPPGDYFIQVQDATGFIFNAPMVAILEPIELTYTLQLVSNDLSILAFGGTGTYEYSIDGGTTFQTSNTFNDLANGNYNIVIKDENGCTIEDTVFVNVNSTEDVKGELQFELMPNPSDGLFSIKLNLTGLTGFQLQVHDVIGREVYASEIRMDGFMQPTLDLRGLASGTYFVKLSNGRYWGVQKLVVVSK